MLRQSLLLAGLLSAATTAFAQAPSDTVTRGHLLSVTTPDPRLNQLLTWAKANYVPGFGWYPAEDAAVSAMMLTTLGQFDAARKSLTAGGRSPLWILSSYEYWLAAGDDAFLREQWPSIVRALDSFAATDAWLASLDVVQQMASALKDAGTRSRVTQLLSTNRKAEADDFALYAALANYNQHRAWIGYRYLSDIGVATVMPSIFVLPFVRGLIGWQVDAPHRAAALEPHLPPEWAGLRVSNLRVGRDRLEANITREKGLYVVSVRRLTPGAPIALRIAPALPAGARVERIVVDDVDVPVHTDESSHDVHAIAEIILVRDVEVAFHY